MTNRLYMDNLESIIKEKGYKKKWIAKKAGVSASTLTNLCKGGKPEIETALRIALVLGKSVEEIWGYLIREDEENGKSDL